MGATPIGLSGMLRPKTDKAFARSPVLHSHYFTECIPSFGTYAPNYYFSIPNEEIERRTFLTSDTCVIDDEHFFVRGCLEIPVIGYTDILSFGAWVSLCRENFEKFENLYDESQRDHHEPMFFLGGGNLGLAIL